MNKENDGARVEASCVLTPARRILYSLGPFGSSLLQQTVLLWVFYFYAPPPDQNLPQRVAPALLGLAMGIGRAVDALADPLVAHWSDRLRWQIGRRRPFILAGAPVLAASFALLWRPPHDVVSAANFFFLAAVLGVFFLVFTLVLNPYMALLPEITEPGRDRVVTSAWQNAFSLTGTSAAFVASSALAARAGFPAMGLVLAPLGLVPLLVAGLAVRERPIADARVDFWPALRTVFGERAFRVFTVGFAFLWLGLSMVNLAMALMVTVLMGLPQAAVGSVLGASVAATLLALPAVAGLAGRLGKPRALLLAMAAAAVILPLLASVGLWPVPLGPAAQGYVVAALAGLPLAALFVLPNAILADIAHALARQKGRRLEGMFFAFQGLILNGATSVASTVLGVVLEALGYGVGLRVVPLLAMACVAAGIAVFRRMPPD